MFTLKKVIGLLTLLIILFFNTAFAQGNKGQSIRLLEQQEMAAMLKGDTTQLLKLWAPQYVVNNPYQAIVTVPEILQFIRKGMIDYSRADRFVEKITFVKNIAIVMGREEVQPQNATVNAGKKVIRRYTHIWMQNRNRWQLVARQATNVLVE